MTELELKLQVAPERRLVVEQAMRKAAPKRTHLIAHYYDTADGCLARHAISLRVRKEGRSWVQTLKAAGSSRIDRLEHNVALPSRRGDVAVADIARHADSDAAQALHDALHDCGGSSSLQLVYSADVWRRSVEINAGAALVEVAFDQGQVTAGERADPICELEYELKGGDASAMVSLAADAARRHGLWLSTLSKSMRGERLLRPDDAVPAVRAREPQLDADMSRRAVMRAVVGSCLDQILGNASEVAAGSRQEEHIHQLRVGIRRMRTALRELGELAPDIDAAAWEAPLVAAFRDLGAYRDKDTVARAVRPQLQSAGAPTLEWHEDPDAAIDPVQAARNPDFQAVLFQLIDFSVAAGSDGNDDGAGAQSVRKLVRSRLKKLHERVGRDGKRFDALDEHAQHRVRKQLKRLRYLAEFVAPLFGARAVERFLQRLRPAQDALGQHNDTAVAASLYEDAARQADPQAWFAVGWLRARRGDTTMACRKALRKVGQAPRFW